MGKGGKGGSDPHVDQLVAKGFGKAKAVQALKDAGNSYPVALGILERQREQQAAKGAKPVGGKKPLPAESMIPSLDRMRHEEEEQGGSAAPTAKRVPLHPCVVQYKQCQFGEYCRLKNLPGDVCINYYNGSCIYGDFCRRRHSVEGVDLREGQRHEISDTFTREDGTKYRIVTSGNGGRAVQVAQLVEDEEGGADVARGKVLYVPDASDFNLVRGSEPSHTDPLLSRGLHTSDPQSDAPRPFLEKLISEAPTRATPPATATTVVRVGASASAPTPKAAPAVVNGRTKHPCIAQCGSCKYGAHCEHADRDADVCVHFLNGRCRFSAEDCRYRHETDAEYGAKLQERIVGGGPAEPASSAPDDGLLPPAVRKKKTRLQSVFPSHPHSSACGRDGGLSVHPSAEALDEAGAERTWEPVAVPSREDRAAVVGHPSPATAADFFPAPDAAVGPSDGGGGWVVSGHDTEPESPALLDTELDTFLGLLEAFPQEEPAFMLQALRSAGGDPVAVADLVGRVEVTTPADIDAALAKALAEEERAEAEADRHSRELVARSEALLTLCFLFPALELSSIEAVYHSRADDFEEAYEALLCSQENITRRDYGNVWRGNVNPAEQLRLEKVKAMFPEIHPDIVRSTFGASDKDSKRTVTALNQLSSELLSLRTRLQMGAAATRWRPHGPTNPSVPSPQQRRPAPSAVDSAATDETEVRRLYKAAEAELRERGDWRRVRLRAYGVNACRLRVLSQASAAYLRGDGALAKALSREGYDLGCEYERLNRLAMLALEMERLRDDPATSLDLHGFHAEEALEVLTRRVDLCQRKRIRFLTIVVGEGHHSRRGEATLARTVTDFVENDPRMRAAVRLVSVKPGCLVARVNFT